MLWGRQKSWRNTRGGGASWGKSGCQSAAGLAGAELLKSAQIVLGLSCGAALSGHYFAWDAGLGLFFREKNTALLLGPCEAVVSWKQAGVLPLILGLYLVMFKCGKMGEQGAEDLHLVNDNCRRPGELCLQNQLQKRPQDSQAVSMSR